MLQFRGSAFGGRGGFVCFLVLKFESACSDAPLRFYCSAPPRNHYSTKTDRQDSSLAVGYYSTAVLNRSVAKSQPSPAGREEVLEHCPSRAMVCFCHLPSMHRRSWRSSQHKTGDATTSGLPAERVWCCRGQNVSRLVFVDLLQGRRSLALQY